MQPGVIERQYKSISVGAAFHILRQKRDCVHIEHHDTTRFIYDADGKKLILRACCDETGRWTYSIPV